ncbi:MAG TPA: cytochrome c biogenesis protein CcsA [Bacteroidota bacterium]|nr:cytochrome c biogenesis protein CcsA [Bacteroidota bacterium]
MVGTYLIYFAFLCAVVSIVSNYITFKRKDDRYIQLTRYSYHFATSGVMTFCALLIYLILTHQFQYTYVWNYSSTDLPLPLLISTFYAGQEGSFSLWALFTAVLGVFLMQYSARKQFESEVMLVWSLVLSFLLLMLIVKNPFALIWDSFPNDLIHSGEIPMGVSNFMWIDQARGIWAQFPSEGKGLNPLLQNYWMVIHPQILFIGFTSMAVPYTFALAGLLRRDYQGWVKIAKPWTVFGGMVLGTGIILGGYWAYETLGWGGYWGWDPVENSSLIPWLVCISSIHTMMAQRRSGTFVRTNFILSIMCFIMVLYSTFLTRSGVLGDTSVHSFVDAGMWAYWLLLGFMVFFGALGIGLLFRRMKEMPKIPVEHSIYSREFALFLGASTICFAAIFITIGTSSPIITNIIKGRAAAVDIAFYVKTTLPLGIIIALLSGFGQLLWWGTSKARDFLKVLPVPFIASLLFTIVLFILGVRDVVIVIFTFASAFALFVNVVVGYRIFRGNTKYAGGAIAHIGVAMLFLGFVSSARYDDKQTVSLEQGKTVNILDDYELTYVGNHAIDDERFGFHVQVSHAGSSFMMMPTMHFSKFSNSTLRHPDVLNLYTKDFYISPLSVETVDKKKNNLTLLKGQKKNILGLGITFIDFDFSDVQKGKMLEGGTFNIGAVMEVEKDGKRERIKPLMRSSNGAIDYIPAKSIHGDAEITIVKIQPNRENPSDSKVEISVQDKKSGPSEPQAESLIIEASVKPFINLVWMGTVTLIVGFVITIIRRVQEAREKD